MAIPGTLDPSGPDTGPLTICCPAGTSAVRALAIGDPILTAAGRTVPVCGIGGQTVSIRFGTADRNRPVRIRAGALTGEGQPLRDRCVTAGHAVLIAGCWSIQACM